METEKNEVFIDLGDAVEAIRTTNEFEADIFISKLRSFGIPAFLSFPGESGAAKTYCGRSNLTIRIMVPLSKLEEAKEILEPSEDYAFPETESDSQPKEPSMISFFAKGFVYLFLLLVVLGIIFLLTRF